MVTQNEQVREATNGLKLDLRQQIQGAGLGRRLANTWRSEVYPKGKKSIRAPVEALWKQEGEYRGASLRKAVC
ncbi:hypothetical protein BEN30_17070 [Magnetovibrio blakemorei]|uniref:Uncharacterized protein n=1 Tax=Magnetovibrio blakemorei TaxID=28181 RepID=A0A1E5Q333_9PROT|nr:hypothetical protein BEN30_17070 [Magnetovibrio blakemorei]